MPGVSNVSAADEAVPDDEGHADGSSALDVSQTLPASNVSVVNEAVPDDEGDADGSIALDVSPTTAPASNISAVDEAVPEDEGHADGLSALAVCPMSLSALNANPIESVISASRNDQFDTAAMESDDNEIPGTTSIIFELPANGEVVDLANGIVLSMEPNTGVEKAKTPKCRKRYAEPDEWSRNVRKRKHVSGQEYISTISTLVAAKSPKPNNCSKCRYRCDETFDEADRTAI